MELTNRQIAILIGAVILMGALALTGCKAEKLKVVNKIVTPKAGAPCEASNQCQTGNACVHNSGDLEFKGGVCTTECSLSSCAPGDLCVTYHGSGESYCLPQCRLPWDCRNGYTCICVGSYHQCQQDPAPKACVPVL